MREVGAPVAADECSATGHVHDVVYLGRRDALCRRAGRRRRASVVMEQNLTTSSMDALQVRDKAVRLVWKRSDNRAVEAPAGADEGSLDQEEGR